ncbi:response regulator transcription factor [Planctomicrobium piriforme]|uniref:Two-component system, OmpR family, response regulator/two-component system, OmpR family, copper resistance phosphate regulon response regulator CusR n=1 Tax=Planctomicrobium piriforme TaxID=1576369 RepID=A0A1I3HP86_9PLAN|nr:response regulator transcription factor [Planctomicrobium piriforme]SFI37330.1 two-component system, OmpR family, response regulator/two-component system, OmpR family, copper resistance phosphate regulon response regulator CusR [Planctomicrobium piriforme]
MIPNLEQKEPVTAEPGTMHVLLVEDDIILGKAVARGLEDARNHCTWLRSGQQVPELLKEENFNVVILDLMLPDMSGIEVLQRIRQAGNHIPVLILTALGSVQERVVGLEAGADDYMVKPFALPELIARLKAVTRRTQKTLTQHLRVGPISLDLSTRRFFREGKEVDLTPTEAGLLEFLMRNADQVVTRKMLCEHLWESDWEGVTNVIEVHINRLRGKIDREFDRQLIQTVRGRGYVLRSS